MLINVRGAFGSGKTTIAKSLIPDGAPKVLLATGQAHKPTRSDPDRMLEKHIFGRTFLGGTGVVIGDYGNACGGLDEYSWKGAHDTICDAIRNAADEFDVVVFEGVTVSGIYQRYVDLAGHDPRRQTHWVFTMPPAQVCLERVALRSGAGINDRNTNSVHDKWRAIKRVHDKAVEERPSNIVLHWHDSTEDAQAKVHGLIETL